MFQSFWGNPERERRRLGPDPGSGALEPWASSLLLGLGLRSLLQSSRGRSVLPEVSWRLPTPGLYAPPEPRRVFPTPPPIRPQALAPTWPGVRPQLQRGVERSLEGLRALPPRQVAPLPQRPVSVRPSATEVPPGSREPVPMPGAQTSTPPMSQYERAWAEWEHKKQLDAQARQQIHGVVQRMGWGAPPAAAPPPPVLMAADLDPGLTRPRGIGFLTPEEARIANPLRPTLQRIQGKLDRGQPLLDWELRLFFGRLEQTQSLLKGSEAKSQVERIIEWAHTRLDEIETSPQSARKNKDGYYILGDRAYGKNEKNLKQIARQTREHFLKTGHYPPTPFPKGVRGPDGEPTPPPNIRWDEFDVTDQVNEELEKLAQQIHRLRANQQFWEPGKIYDYFRRNFGDNGIHDFQVGHGLPGQAPLYDPRTGHYLTDAEGNVFTIDEFAKFNGQVVKAGYISNYAYGYAAAAAGVLRDPSLWAAQIVSWVGSGKPDNERDLEAVKFGYRAYKKRSQRLVP